MATTPAQKRTPRRRDSASAATAAAAEPAPASAAAPELSAAEAPAAKPARKTAAKTPAKTAARKATRAAAPAQVEPAQAIEAPAETTVTAPAATASKKAAKSAAKPAAKTAAKTAPKKAAGKSVADLTGVQAEPAVDAAVEPASSPAKKVATKAPAAKKAAARKTAGKAPARKAGAGAAKTAAAAEPATAEAPVPEALAADAATGETAAPSAPARKRSPRKAAAPVEAVPLTAAAEADAEAEALAAPDAPRPAAASDEPAIEPATEPAVEPETQAAAAQTAPETSPDHAADTSEATGPDADEDTDASIDDATSDTAEAEAEAGTGTARSRNRRNRRRGRDRQRGDRAERPARAAASEGGSSPADAPQASQPAAHTDAETGAAEGSAPAADLQVEAPAAPAAPVAPARPARPTASGPAHSTLRCVDGDLRRIVWQTGASASDALYFAALERLGADGQLREDDDDSLPRLLRQAGDEGHRVDVDPAVWAQLAARRDARTRAGVLMAAYPDGPASAGLTHLLAAQLPLFQAEGALWAVVAGRGLLADERGLGKSVQAIAAALLWRRHFGLRRIAVISGAGERLAWQRAWRRFAGVEAQVMEGGLHQRQAFWSQAAEVRILAPEALASDAAHLAHWAPELVIVDEPQRLALDAEAWATLEQAPQALVLCGAPLDDQPALLEQLVAWLDRDRLGALAALREVQAAREGRAELGEADLERVSDALSRNVLQRQRAEVAEQLPPLVYSERIVPLAPAQREAHDLALATLRRALSGWQASGYLSDTDQWRLATTLRAALSACHRADPAVADSPLGDAVVQAAAEQLQAWAPGAEADAPLQVAVLCETEADAAQLGAALRARGLDRPGIELLAADQTPSAAPDAVLHLGVPWKARRAALKAAGAAAAPSPGQQWLLLVAQDSLESALFDTLAARTDVPRSAAEPGGRGFLQGERLLAWLQAVQLALQAIPAVVPSVGAAG